MQFPSYHLSLLIAMHTRIVSCVCVCVCNFCKNKKILRILYINWIFNKITLETDQLVLKTNFIACSLFCLGYFL